MPGQVYHGDEAVLEISGETSKYVSRCLCALVKCVKVCADKESIDAAKSRNDPVTSYLYRMGKGKKKEVHKKYHEDQLPRLKQ